MTTREPLPLLLLGLLIGVLGSYSDDLFGASGAVAVLQIALWVAGGVLIIAALLSIRGRRHIRHGQLHPSA